MSRTRIVKGKITEIIGGDLCYFSEADIVEYGAETYIEQSAIGIHHGGEPNGKPVFQTVGTKVKTIICVDELDNGSANDDSGTSTKKGVLYNKAYRFEVSEFTDDNPVDPESIRWAIKYINPETGEKHNNVLTDKNYRGKSISIRFKSKDYCGRNLEVRAYVENAEAEGKLPIFQHNRFRWFDEKIFLKGLQERIDKPYRVAQHHTSLCGTAAIFYLMLKLKHSITTIRKEFSTFFRTGIGKINDFSFDPNPSIFEMKPVVENKKYPRYTKYSDGTLMKVPELMHFTDWITLTTLRSSKNKNYEGHDGEDWDAINWPSYMKEAIRELLKPSEIIDKTRIITGLNFINELEEIQEEFENGWNFILLIDSDMLFDSISYSGCLTNYHWIVYLGGLKIEDNLVKFDHYTWEEERKGIKYPIRKTVFNTNYYGYIKFKI